LTSGSSDNEANNPEAVRRPGLFTECIIAVVIVERARGEGQENEWNDEFVLQFGFDLALGVEGQLLAGCGVGSSEGCLDRLRGSVGQDKLAEVEVKCARRDRRAGLAWTG
jgi:hypothetical protein